MLSFPLTSAGIPVSTFVVLYLSLSSPLGPSHVAQDVHPLL